MKAIFATILMLFGSICFANPEINTAGGASFCHFPLDPGNANNEVFRGACPGDISVYNGVADGTITVEGQAEIPPRGLEPGQNKHKYTKTVTSAEANFACELTESNGTTYNSNNWIGYISYHAKNKKLKMVLTCLDGQQ